jgi:catechol 2,3-dioxygenase-like lactoylglutathione lyase family enzyme
MGSLSTHMNEEHHIKYNKEGTMTQSEGISKGGAMKVQTWSHLTMVVSDMDRSLDFYKNVLGFETLFDVNLEGPDLEAMVDTPGAKGRMAGGLLGGSRVELLCFEYPKYEQTPQGLGYGNMALRVDDAAAAYAEAKRQGIPTGSEPADIVGHKMFMVLDPDGTQIEIIQYPPETGWA